MRKVRKTAAIAIKGKGKRVGRIEEFTVRDGMVRSVFEEHNPSGTNRCERGFKVLGGR